MWIRGRRTALGVLTSLAVCVGVASAQYYPNQPSGPSSAPPAAQGMTHTVGVGTATIKGKAEKVLVDARGMTLYWLADDGPMHSACTAACAETWPPLLSRSAPTAAKGLAGKLTVDSAGNGPQVRYNDHLLYRYSGDSAPGQANGDGLAGKWHAARPAPSASASADPSNTSNPGDPDLPGRSHK
jgi:predicted lipoprotein with Yx(FWY)xxD motif